MIYLADTSLWIEWLKKDTRTLMQPEEWLKVVTCPPIIQELLQGIPAGRNKEIFRERLLSFHCIERNLPLDLYLDAAEIYSNCREKGLTVRSSVDCLIAAIAIKNKIPIKHKDRDFTSISKVTSLKVVH